MIGITLVSEHNREMASISVVLWPSEFKSALNVKSYDELTIAHDIQNDVYLNTSIATENVQQLGLGQIL